MKIIKGILIVIAGFFVLITLISLMMPSTVVTVKSTSVHAANDKIVAAIQNLNEWKKWHPLFQSQAGLTISNPSSGKNAKATWIQNGKQNEIVITEVTADGIRFNVTREGENPIDSYLAALPVQEPNTLQVQWRAITKLKWYPWEKFGGIFVTEMTGPGYEQALAGLKKFIETN